MENPAPFDLNDSIGRWREHVSRLPSFRMENLNELESHLRDSISRLQTGGLSEEEAWTIAQKRLGRIDALEQEFGKLTAHSAQPSSPRSRLVRSFIAVGVGAIVTILLGSLGEWHALQSLLEYHQPDTLKEERIQDFSNFTQFAVLLVLMAAVVGGYLTALIAKHHPVRHALAAGGILWGCLTIRQWLYIDPWLLWLMLGAAMTGAMVLGALLRERHPFNWNSPRLTENDYRRFSRRMGVLSVCCMIACIMVGLAERFFPSIAISLLHSIEVWLLWGTMAGWSTAFILIVVRKVKFGKAARLA